MARKYIIQGNAITKVVYVGGCQSAKGGRQKVREQADLIQGQTMMDEGIDVAGISEEISNGTLIHGEYHEKNYRAREKKRKQTVEELIINNFEPCNSCMLTLTFSEHEQTAETYEEVPIGNLDLEQEIAMMADCLNHPEGKKTVLDSVKIYDPNARKYCDLSYCNKLYKQFVQRMKYRFPLFRYVGVMAQQKNGNWHYHIVCNLNYIPFDELRTIWGNGAVYFRSFKQTGLNGMWKAVHYLQKNMRKAELKGEKGYLASKGLNRNIIYRSWEPNENEAAKEIEDFLQGKTPDRKYETSHNYYGVDDTGVFDKELTVETKFFKFFTTVAAPHFPKLPNAYRPKGAGV